MLVRGGGGGGGRSHFFVYRSKFKEEKIYIYYGLFNEHAIFVTIGQYVQKLPIKFRSLGVEKKKSQIYQDK